jgi:outer membrane protein assembly factor BamB
MPKFASSSAAPREPGAPDHIAQPVCQVDANGDGVADLLGMATMGTANHPSVVDGATGKLLWSGSAQTDTPQLACLDTRWFVLVQSNFQAEFHDVRNLGAPVRVLLRDKLGEFAMGRDCVRLKTDDGSVQGVRLPGGAAVSCDAKLKRYHREQPGVIGLTGQRTEISRGKRTYELSKRQRGTEILSVQVEENGKEVWSRELPYAAPTFNSAIAVGGNSIAVWAAAPGDQQHGILVGLDENTGEQRYAVPSSAMVSHSVGHFAFNGRYVIVQVWGSLEAYEPDTGKLAWKIGR